MADLTEATVELDFARSTSHVAAHFTRDSVSGRWCVDSMRVMAVGTLLASDPTMHEALTLDIGHGLWRLAAADPWRSGLDRRAGQPRNRT